MTTASPRKLPLPLLFMTVVALLLTWQVLKPVQTSSDPRSFENLPWQITLFDDGSSEVFGIRLGHSSLDQVHQLLGEEYKIAIIQHQGQSPGLEAFVSHFKAGPLSGQLVLSLSASPEQLSSMVQAAPKMDYMASGARQYSLTASDLEVARQRPIRGINFLPRINLDEEIISRRFGPAEEIIASSENTQHFLFPRKGLDIVLNQEGREVLQFVAPADFARLRAPLQGP